MSSTKRLTGNVLVPTLAICLVVLGPCVTCVFGINSQQWRVWQAEQGLTDSNVEFISRGPNGVIWAVHGDSPAITRFDGRRFTGTPAVPHFNRLDSLDGENGWIGEYGGLYHLQNGRWDVFPHVRIFPLSKTYFQDRYFRVLDLGNSRALLILEDHQLALFSALSGRLEPLQLPSNSRLSCPLSFERDLDGGVWTIGTNGVAHFSWDFAASTFSGWKEYLLGNLPVGDLKYPVAGVNGELFLSGIRKGTKLRVGLSLRNGRWEMIAHQQLPGQSLYVWRDGSGDLWSADGDVLQWKPSRGPSNNWQSVEQQSEVLSGRIKQIVVNPDGTFFLATSRGLALHSNVSWRAYEHVTDSHGRPLQLGTQISSVLEDSKQRLWFLSERGFFRYYRGQWDEVPFPEKRQHAMDFNCAQVLANLPDGRFLIQFSKDDFYLTIFDPDKLTLTDVQAPAGHCARMFCRRADGKFLVALVNKDSHGDDSVGILEGDAVTPLTSIHAKWAMRNTAFNNSFGTPRAMLQDNNGDIWLGALEGLFRLSNGQYQRLDRDRANESGQTKRGILGVFSLFSGGDEPLLIGGREELLRIKGSGFEVVTDRMQIARQIIRARSGALWVASSSGVFRSFRRGQPGDNPALIEWISSDTSDGLPSTAVYSILEDSHGDIWVGTARGPAVYRSGIDLDPPEAIVQASHNSNEAGPSGQFRIIFSGKDKWDLTPSHLLQFSYRFDQGRWSPFDKDTMAVVQKPSIGKHKFEVVAMDREGNISPVPASFDFSVLPPWYRSPAFLLLTTLTSITIVYLMWLALHHYQVRGHLISQLSIANENANRLRSAAESVSRSKSEFLANMSHEIRTPMNGILGMTDLALSSQNIDELHECLTMVKSSGESLLTIINDILDYSKIEAGKLSLDPVQFNLWELVGDTVKNMAVSAHKKRLEITFHLQPNVPHEVIADSGRLRQVMLNLLGNAIKFTSEGEIVLTASVVEQTDRTLLVQFTTRDTGIGIPQEQLERVFNAFEQADASTTRRFGGTGLGLSISSRIVGLMGGRIWVESAAGKGSSFHFTTCLTKAAQGPAEVGSAGEFAGLRVLVVDDNPTSRDILGSILKNWGVETVMAESGSKAIALLREMRAAEHKFKVIFLDEQMPQPDGLAVLEYMRVHLPSSPPAVMLLSSADWLASADRCRGAGAGICLIKPAKVSELRSAIKRSLGRGETEVPLPRTEIDQPRRSLRLLVAEDNVINQKLAARMLEKMGHSVELASNGKEAIQKWAASEFDIVFMDVQMPEMDGLTATHEIRLREMTSGKHTPIIAMTANAMTGDREVCLAAGMDDYVSKPISRDTLARCLAQFSLEALPFVKSATNSV